MKEIITTEWLGKMAFRSTVNGHDITLDAKSEFGGEDKGPRPKPLMMVALAGCTGMDVISILQKMRVNVEKFEVSVEGDITETHPKHFTSMHIVYTFHGKNLAEDKIRKAIALSQDEYCGVSAMYRKAMALTFDIKIVET